MAVGVEDGGGGVLMEHNARLGRERPGLQALCHAVEIGLGLGSPLLLNLKRLSLRRASGVSGGSAVGGHQEVDDSRMCLIAGSRPNSGAGS
jgi:hypothetical protein